VDIKLKIKTALLELNIEDSELRKILQSISPAYTGFVEAKHEDYDNIRKLMVNLDML
jgi:ABC-type phosphate/phosphonate transport system substrate-binding protein